MDDFKKKLLEIKKNLIKENQVREEKKRKEEPVEEKVTENYLSDEELFEREMEGVRKIPRDGRIPKKSIPKTPKVSDEDDEIIHTLSMLIDGDIEFRINDTAEYIEGYNVKDYDPNVLKKLKKGEIAYQDYIDLHGKTKDEAKSLVKNFIEQSRKFGMRCVLIVHGKGIHSKDYMPVLKESLKGWLSGKSTGRHILAFCSATPRDGGTGAIYVLLRK